MSLKQHPAILQPLFNSIRFSKPSKRQKPKLNLYRPTGAEQQTCNFEQLNDEKNQNDNAFIEDSRKTNFTYRGFLQSEMCLLILSITSFFVQIHYEEYNDYQLEFESNILLFTQSIVTLAILILLIIRYKLFLQLRKEQKIQSLNATIFHKDYVPYLIIEMAICIVHPMYPTKDVGIILFEPYDQISVQHQLNDLLALFMLCRVYLILRSLVISTLFAGTRAARLCRVYGCDHSFMFSIKCIMKQIPLRALAFLFLMMLTIYGQGLRISQHNLIKYYPGSFDLSKYQNCFWMIIITMGTLGYGDYFPKTYPGRGITFLASISGVIMTSLLIITLSRYFTMQTTQTKAHITHQRLKLRNQLQKSALQAVKQTAIMSYNLHTDNPNVQSSFANLKKQALIVKIAMRKLQTIIDTQNVSQQMNRLFQILQMSLKQIYQNQLQVKSLLQNLYKQQKNQLRALKFSFSTEIEKLIKQY